MNQLCVILNNIDCQKIIIVVQILTPEALFATMSTEAHGKISIKKTIARPKLLAVPLNTGYLHNVLSGNVKTLRCYSTGKKMIHYYFNMAQTNSQRKEQINEVHVV